MEIAVLVLTVLVLVMAEIIRLFHREMKHMYRQLDLIERGSHIELTAQTGTRYARKVYRKLNGILGSYQKHEEEYLRSQKLLKQTISNIAHDIRTPLTGAMGYVQMIEEVKEEEKRSRYLEIIGRRLEELKSMLEELFLYTKLISPDFTLECSSIPVFPALCKAIAVLYHAFEEENLEPEVKFEQKDIAVAASQDGLERVFYNLIQNALQHGTGTIRITQKGSSMYFFNRISGEEDIDTTQLFERFYKAEKSRTKGSSGLGLAIVKELMERMGGRVSAEQKEGGIEIGIHFLV